MKLLTHNMLISNVKGVKNPYPLQIKPSKVEVEQNEFNKDFILHMLPKLDYKVVVGASRQCNYMELPEELPDNMLEDEDFLMKLHHALVNIKVVEGELVCPETGRVFPIKNEIPNMLLNEDEV